MANNFHKNNKNSYIQKEKKILEYWKQNKIFEKSVLQRPEKNSYVFYDGPPFATGLPHYGHILSSTAKDVFPRFWTMKNYRVERRWGWDCHGLPVESISERELKIKRKNEIYEMGVARFNEYCRSKVQKFANEWKDTVERVGRWIHFDNSYKTMDNSYMETVWFLFKKIYNDGFIYKSKKVLLYCPRCETPLSNSEIAMDNSYQDITESTLYVKFNLKDDKSTFFLAWTTTPWTLIGNVALAINGDVEYVKIKIKDENYILAKNRLAVIGNEFEIIDEFKGQDLVNREYIPLYSISTELRGFYIVDGGNSVLSDEGTGIIHLALYGEFDYDMIKKYNLPIIQHIDNHGELTLGPDEWKGKWFKEVNNDVVGDLELRNLILKSEGSTHSYPFCYRCDTPLIYNALDAWFINIQSIKSKLIEASKLIRWYPDKIQGRFNHILETAPDWCISRNRFWATAIPIWQCSQCNNFEVVGSVEELRKKAIEDVPNDLDLHKHVVDEIHIRCSCGRSMSRVPEVLDCWFESGSMPFAAKHYPFENISWFETNFPSDFVSEYIGQVRAWFYYMHVISVLTFDTIPFRNVVVNGNILASDGTKMSKSKKNFPDPNLIIEKYGADALRIYLMSSQLMRSQDLSFREDSIQLIFRRFNLLLINILKFYSLFETDTYESENLEPDHILDKWIISLTNKLIKGVTENMEIYNTTEVCNLYFRFIDDLSTWYIKNSRNRFKSSDFHEKLHAIKTLTFVLVNLSKLIAPMTPFISEMIYQALKEREIVSMESVHLEFWPEYDEKSIHLDVQDNMDLTRDIVNKSLDLRDKSKIPIRQSLNELIIKGITLGNDYTNIIQKAINVKNVIIQKGSDFSLHLDTQITHELKVEGISRNLIRHINNNRKKMKLSTKNRINLYIKTTDSDLQESLNIFENEIKNQIQADNIILNSLEKFDYKNLKIGQKLILVFIDLL